MHNARQEFSFLWMWSIHPLQIEVILDALKLDFSNLQKACTVLLDAQDNDWGPIQQEGELYDRANYRDLWQLVQQAQKFCLPLSEEIARRLF